MEPTQKFCSNSCHLDNNPEWVIWWKCESLWDFLAPCSLHELKGVETVFYVCVFVPHSTMHFVPLDLFFFFCLQTLCDISIPVALQGSCDLRQLPPSTSSAPSPLLSLHFVGCSSALQEARGTNKNRWAKLWDVSPGGRTVRIYIFCAHLERPFSSKNIMPAPLPPHPQPHPTSLRSQ